MKRIILMLLLLAIPIVYAAEIPQETDTVLLNKIDTEHKNTRQYFSNELEKQKTDAINEFTSRADFYDSEFERITTNTVLKLALVWLGVFMFAVGLNSYLALRLERRRYNILKDAIKKDIIQEVSNHIPTPTTAQNSEKKSIIKNLLLKPKKEPVVDKKQEILNTIKEMQENLKKRADELEGKEFAGEQKGAD